MAVGARLPQGFHNAEANQETQSTEIQVGVRHAGGYGAFLRGNNNHGPCECFLVDPARTGLELIGYTMPA